jgi:hypothetical protein
LSRTDFEKAEKKGEETEDQVERNPNPEVSLTAIGQVSTVLPKILGDFLSAKSKCPNYTGSTDCTSK